MKFVFNKSSSVFYLAIFTYIYLTKYYINNIMSLLQTIKNLSFKERYEIFELLTTKEKILVDSSQNVKQVNLEP
jgi:hypothetical protein